MSSYSAIPAELRALDHWLVWRYEVRGGRRTKVPYDAKHPRRRASSTNPATWSSFETTVEAAQWSDTDGIGFAVEGTEYVAVDLDGCVNQHAEPHQAAIEIIDELDSYTEISPSGRGLRIVVRAALHSERNSTKGTPWGDEFAVFARGKYLTLTGDVFGERGEIRERQQQLDRVVLRMLPARRTSHPPTGAFSPTDEEVISRAFTSKSGRRIQALYNGDSNEYDSPSEADCALVAALAFYFYSQDEEQLARILRGSARAREKLNREDYVQRTVSKAVEICAESYDWSRTAQAPGAAGGGRLGSGKTALPERPGRRVELTPARSIRSERVRWLWRDRLPLRSLSVVAGEKGLGKSILTNARLVAEVTRGTLLGELFGQPVDVLVCTAEDDWASVVKPRLMVHNADLNRVHRVAVRDDAGQPLLTLPDDVQQLEAQIELLRASGRVVGMFVLDPIGAFLSQSTDTHRDASVRRALAPLAAMAENLDLVVLVVAHLTKDESSRLINRVSGAGAFVNAARSLLVLARSPDDPDGEQGRERVLVHVGSNWGQYARSLGAYVDSRELDLDDGSRAGVGYLQITGECDIGVEDLQRGRDENGGTDMEEAIGAALKDGPRPSREVKAQIMAEVNCGKRTVERAAERMREIGELLIDSGGFPRMTTWALHSRDSEPSRSRATSESTVAPSTNTRSGVTDSFAVVTEDSASSGASGDCLESAVATARVDRIRAAAQAVTCCCADGGERGDDGRCGRCYGRVGPIEYQDGGAA